MKSLLQFINDATWPRTVWRWLIVKAGGMRSFLRKIRFLLHRVSQIKSMLSRNLAQGRWTIILLSYNLHIEGENTVRALSTCIFVLKRLAVKAAFQYSRYQLWKFVIHVIYYKVPMPAYREKHLVGLTKCMTRYEWIGHSGSRIMFKLTRFLIEQNLEVFNLNKFWNLVNSNGNCSRNFWFVHVPPETSGWFNQILFSAQRILRHSLSMCLSCTCMGKRECALYTM